MKPVLRHASRSSSPARARLCALSLSVLGLALLLARPALTRAQDPSGATSATPAPVDAPFTPQFHPALETHRAPGPIRIDGDLDDPGWRDASRALGFAEVQPGDQVRPPVDSEAWVAYDEHNLYLAFIAYDDPSQVRVSWRERDNIFSDDYYGLMLDTFGDHAWGYEFFVNPLGIQGDLRMDRNGEEDISFDLIWHSRGRLTDRGYQVEIAIPFASLRFPDAEEQTWRVNFWRDHQRTIRRRYAWAATNRDDPCFMCQWGTLTGIRGIHPGRNLEAIANIIGYQNGERVEVDSTHTRFRYDDLRGEPSLNLRYALTSTSSLEMAFNPDFSQIESDAGRIDVNEPFAIYYAEKRPFFQEGSELYSTEINAVYTRSIFDPDQAAKLTGRFGANALAWTFAHDRDSPVILPLEERSFRLQAKETVSNILRLRHSFGEESYAGALLTDRRLDGGGSGTVLGADGAVRFLRHLHLECQALVSYTQEPRDSMLANFRPVSEGLFAQLDTLSLEDGSHTLRMDGEKLRGHGLFTGLVRSGRVWNSVLEFRQFHPEFRADNGFVTRTNYRSLEGWTGFLFRPQSSVLVSCEPSVAVGRVWDYDKHFQDEWIVPAVGVDLAYQTHLGVESLWSRERFRDRIFPGIRRITIEASTRLSEGLGFGLSMNRGRTIRRTFAADEEPVLARNLSVSANASIKLFRRVALQPELTYFRLKTPDGRDLYYDLYIARNRLDLQVNRETSVRLVTEYGKENRSLIIEPLLTYRINPFSVFYLGLSDLVEQGDTSWVLRSRQVFAKLQYLFRL